MDERVLALLWERTIELLRRAAQVRYLVWAVAMAMLMVQCNRLKTIESAVASLDSRFDGIICARPAQITEAQTGIEAHISAACQDCAICKELQ